jgi:hypothetical protein
MKLKEEGMSLKKEGKGMEEEGTQGGMTENFSITCCLGMNDLLGLQFFYLL